VQQFSSLCRFIRVQCSEAMRSSRIIVLRFTPVSLSGVRIEQPSTRH
jgi:hypothetical protein